MEFLIRIRELGEKALDLHGQLQTEEATKTALVMPFISLLGYDVFNPREVVPEFTADVGIKKGEKVDYAIQKLGQPIILIECKISQQKLDNIHTSQLYRYFTATKARFGVLTNGILYWFYTDLDAPNVMDQKPFLEFDLLNIRESVVEELRKFAKDTFDVDQILSTASELKYLREIKNILAKEYEAPSEDIIRFITSQVYPGHKLTQQVREEFATLTRRAFHQFVNDKINERLKSAIAEELPGETASATDAPAPAIQPIDSDDREAESRIDTTEDELHAFYLVKAILHGIVEPKRVFMRDRISYCGVLLDDNNRKPLCRLHFNGGQRYLGLFNSDKTEERVLINAIDDIYGYAERLRATAESYLKS